MTDFTKEVPLDWLRKTLEREFTAEEKAKIEKMGWDEPWKRSRSVSRSRRSATKAAASGSAPAAPRLSATAATTRRASASAGEGRNKSAVKVWDQRAYKDYDDSQELGTRNIKIALRRLRKFAREGHEDELDLDDTIRSTAANAGYLDIKMLPERHNNVKVLLLMDVGGTMDEHIQRVEELFSAAKAEFKHLEFYYFHNCVYDFMWKNNRRRFSREVRHLGHHPQVQQGLQADLRRRRDHEPLRDPAAGRQRGIQQRGSRRRVDPAPDPCLPEVRLDQPGTAGRVAVPAEHCRDAATRVHRMYPLTLKGLEEAMRLLSK